LIAWYKALTSRQESDFGNPRARSWPASLGVGGGRPDR
jgi:hypothetical protein